MPVVALGIRLLNDSADQVDLALAQPDIRGLLVLPDLRLRNAADDSGNCPPAKYPDRCAARLRCSHAPCGSISMFTPDIQIGELRIDQRTDTDAATPG